MLGRVWRHTASRITVQGRCVHGAMRSFCLLQAPTSGGNATDYLDCASSGECSCQSGLAAMMSKT